MWVRTMGPGKGPGEGAPRYPGGCLVSDTPVVDQIDNHRSDWGLIRSILFTTRSREGRGRRTQGWNEGCLRWGRESPTGQPGALRPRHTGGRRGGAMRPTG
jgi:hypothetical protein